MKLRPAIVFGEHMILQRHKPIRIWGTCAGGDTVAVTLGGARAVCASQRGKWSVTLPAMEAAEQVSLCIKAQGSGEKLCFTDVAVGEVWLAGGQSNMEFLFKYDVNAAELVPQADDPLLRFFDMPEVTFPGQYELGYFEDYGFWRRWTPADAPWFSAVGYYFARQLRQKLGVPVGILGCNYGGTAAFAWTDPALLKADPALQPVLDFYARAAAMSDPAEYEAAALQNATRDPAPMQPFIDNMMMGEPMTMPAMPEGFQPPESSGPKPFFMMTGPKSANAPGVLYENMLKPVTPYGVRGCIWYQGETDDDYGFGPFYDLSIGTLVRCWRRDWGEELPFLQVMLAPYAGMPGGPFGAARKQDYPMLRRKQLAACGQVKDVYCACINDAGDPTNIHPRRKQPAGERLALLAEKYVYGLDGVEADSPSPISAVRTEAGAEICFQNAAGGLRAQGGVQGLKVLADGAEVPAQATAEGDRVLVAIPGLGQDAALTFLYAEENYCEPNLYGGTGLPAYPFTLTLGAAANGGQA